MKRILILITLCIGCIANAITPIKTQWWDLDTHEEGISQFTQASDFFGWALSHGDYNGDGYQDIAIGSPGFKNSEGSVTIFYGTDNGVTFTGFGHFREYTHLTQTNNSLDVGPQAGDSFGRSLTTGDFNGDGFDDLVVGSPFENIESYSVLDAGAINIFYGDVNGLQDSDFIFEDENHQLSGPENQSNYGFSLVAGDFNGDGYDELVVSVPQATITINGNQLQFAGKVYIYTGSPAHINTSNAHVITQNNSFDSVEAFDLFGYTLTVGDFDRKNNTKGLKGTNNYEDLVVGIPFEDFGNVKDAGAVQVFYGSSSGLDGRNQFLTQNNTTDETLEVDDNFGLTLVAGDFNRTTSNGLEVADDLLVGVPKEDIGNIQDAGVVNVFYGSSSGLTTNNNQTISQNTAGIFGIPEQFDNFGSALSSFYARDANINAKAVITAAGETYQGTADGVAYIVPGSSSGLDATQSQFISNIKASSSSSFGFTVTAFTTFSKQLKNVKASSIVFGIPGATSNDGDEKAGAIYEMNFSKFIPNSGINGAWYNPQTSGQGVLFDLYNGTNLLFAAWFTYDTTHPSTSIPSLVGSNDARWLTASGPLRGGKGNGLNLQVFDSSNGKFNDTTNVFTTPVGGMRLSFSGCDSAYIDYDLFGVLEGYFPIERILNDNEYLCEYINSPEVAKTLSNKKLNSTPRYLTRKRAFKVNAAMSGAWYNPITSGQGFLIDVLPVTDFMFLSWFTYDTNFPAANLTSNIGNPGNRWLTASGILVEEGISQLDVYDSTGGLFNNSAAVTTIKIGSMSVSFNDCETGQITFVFDNGLNGTIPIQRVVNDNVALCESLNATGK